MVSDLDCLFEPSKIILKPRQRHFLDLVIGGAPVQSAEMLAGLRAGSVHAAAERAREARSQGRKPDAFGEALLLVEAASEAELARAENALLDEGGAAGVTVLKMKKREAEKKRGDGSCPKCARIDKLIQDGIDRAHAKAMQRRRRG